MAFRSFVLAEWSGALSVCSEWFHCCQVTPSSLYVNSRLSGNRRTVSFFSFYRQAVVAAFVVFHFHSFEEKVISLLIPMQMWLEGRNAKLLEIKRGRENRMEIILFKRWFAQIPEKYLWTWRSSLTKRRIFFKPPFSRLMFFAQRGHFKKKANI